MAPVSSNRQVSGSGFLLTLVAAIPAPVPGQFVMLGLPENAAPFLRRPFSVFDFDAGQRRLKIFYYVSGSGTEALSRVRRGEELGLLGPLGRPFPESPRPLQVIVGGGRGCAPLVFLSRRRHKTTRVFFLAGARREDEIPPLDGIKASRVFVSTEDGSFGKKGSVLDLMKSVGASPDFEWSSAVLYGCGPVGMLGELHRFAVKKGVSCFVSLEARMGCGLGVCQGCAVATGQRKYSLVCTDGPVFDSSSVDWELYSGVREREDRESDILM
ncbi:MAG: hypothetical protein AMJ46_00675 [Latescibacteria bacterium DG_63]|nr:MAG: hypothetical protein AMJ46_00675 [Latescibacteria bacterium DG_63]